MKKLLTALIACAVFFAACPTDDGNGNGNQTTLTIINMNFNGYCEVAYGDVKFDLVHNTEVTKTVNAGTRYAYITYHYFTQDEHYAGRDLETHNRSCSCPVFRTDSITCEEGKNSQFSLTRNTVVTLIGGFGYDKFADVTGTLQDITTNIDDYYTEYMNLKTMGFNQIQTWFWDLVESFNDAPEAARRCHRNRLVSVSESALYVEATPSAKKRTFYPKSPLFGQNDPNSGASTRKVDGFT